MIPKNNAKNILYLSYNDGSDMRINKEVTTLSKFALVDFMGIGECQTNCFINITSVQKIFWTNANRKTVRGNLKYFSKAIWLLVTKKYHSIHVINETQLFILWPLLFIQKNVVVDVFDSIFLKKNYSGNKLQRIKQILYWPAKTIIVTDQNRYNLLPDSLKFKTNILPNYPFKFNQKSLKSTSNELTIIYFGWIGSKRGTETILRILDTGLPVKIIMAGWLADEESKQLIKHKNVTWYGTVSQAEAFQLAQAGNYILCVYAPIHENNINASPNKIFDAIQLQKPLIINREIVISKFVEDEEIGYILPKYSENNWMDIVLDLSKLKDSYTFKPSLIETYTWENVANKLLESHHL